MAFDPSTLTNILAGLKGAGGGGGAASTRSLDFINAGLGAAGAASFFGAKKPQISRPDQFQSVAPVQNYEADRQQGYNQIAQNASSAMNNVRSQLGGDWSAYASAALGVNAQSNQAQQQVNSQIGQQKRADNISLAQQLSADKEFNYNTQRSFDEAQYNQQQQAYQGQRQQGAGMMQGSLNYLTQQNAANRAFDEKQVAARQAIDGTALEWSLRGAQTQGERDAVLSQNLEMKRYMSPTGQETYYPTQAMQPKTQQANFATPLPETLPGYRPNDPNRKDTLANTPNYISRTGPAPVNENPGINGWQNLNLKNKSIKIPYQQ